MEIVSLESDCPFSQHLFTEDKIYHKLFVQPLKCGAFSGGFVGDLCRYRRTCFQAVREWYMKGRSHDWVFWLYIVLH